MPISASKGATLIDTVVATGLLLVVFVGISAAFQLTIDVVTNNKARAGALALANEQLEYIRSLAYDSVGTSGGIPPGVIPATEDIVMNGITYTRRTHIIYVDDPEDGLAGADENGVITDYKSTKVEVSWTARNGGTRRVVLVTRVSPVALELATPGGTLSLSVIGAGFQPISGAQVLIMNTTTVPPINTTLYTDESGNIVILGAPPSAGYEIVVSKAGHTTARTYAATAQNTNPTPGHLTVALNQTTSSTFSIDLLASKNVRTYSPVETRSFDDVFNDEDLLSELTNTAVSGSAIILSGDPGDYAASGAARSVPIATSTPITAWHEATWEDTRPALTNILYRVYNAEGSALVPDSQIPGNSTGFIDSPIDLSDVSTSTYQALSLQASLGSADPNETPRVRSWGITFDTGPIPYPNLTFGLRGTKTIGSGPSGQILAYSTTTLSSGPSAGVTISALEWDSYTITLDSGNGYDIASSCTPQPQDLAPGEYQTTDIIIEPHTAHSLLVDVRDSSGSLVPGATVRVYRGAIDQTEPTGSCGQVFFSALSEGTQGGGNPYSITVTATGFPVYNASNVNVSGTSRYSVILN